VPTDTFGLYSLQIGSTSGSGTGNFSSIAWSSGNKWIEVSVDPAGGSNLQLVSSQQLMSVPYALYAETSGSGGGGSISGIANNIPRINSNGNGTGKSLLWQSADSSSIGINTPSPMSNAILDISSSTKGILIPRISSTQRVSGITNPNHGLLVFQRDNGGITNPEGFWYYDSLTTAWLFMAPAQAVWTLSGNYLSTPGTNYIGTGDDKDVVFKTGTSSFTQVERMRILSNTNGGNVQFGNPGAGTHYIFPAAKGNPGDILQLDPGGTNNLLWKNPNGSGSFWSTNGNAATAADFLGTTNNVSLNIGTTNTVTPQNIQFYTNGGEQMRIQGSNGFVGMGTNTPQARLHITDNTAAQVLVQNTNQSSESRIDVMTGTSSNNIETVVSSVDGSGSAGKVGRVGTVTDHDLTLITGNAQTERIRISYLTGHVGIGVGAPQSHLHVSGKTTTDSLRVDMPNAQPGYVLTSDALGNANWAPLPSGGGQPWTLSGNNVFTSNAQYNVGIGNNSPNALLQITNLVAGSVTPALDVATSGTGKAASVAIVNTANDSSALTVYTNGTGNSLFSYNQGTGSAGYFIVNNGSSTGSAILAGTNSGGKAIYGINSGTGYGGAFIIMNTANDSAAIIGATNGNGPALSAYNSGLGYGGAFEIVNPSNINDAVFASTAGTGSAGNFQINNSSSNARALYSTTNGGGNAAEFTVNNASSNGNALLAQTSGVGNAITATNSGSNGGAGFFNQTNASNTTAALTTTTLGKGNAAYFSINNANSTSSAVDVSTNGTGRGLEVDKSGTAGEAAAFFIQDPTNSSAGVYISQLGTGAGLYSYHNGTGGPSGSFNVINTGNTASALVASTNGTGEGLTVTVPPASGANSASFTGGAGLKTDNFTMTNGANQGMVLTSMNTSGNAAWTPFPGAISFSANNAGSGNINVGTSPVAIPFGAIDYNNGGNYNGGTDKFTAPNNGIYHFDVNVNYLMFSGSAGNNYEIEIMLYVNGTSRKYAYTLMPGGATASTHGTAALSCDVQLASGSTVQIFMVTSYSPGVTVAPGSALSFFSGHKVF
jgi:hypothetical protein